MRVLVFGNLGYVGPILTQTLRARGDVHITGFDTGYFEQCWSGSVGDGINVDRQLYGDVRDIGPDSDLFVGVDAVIYLAAISNDPMGKAFAAPTHAVNQHSAVKIAEFAKSAGVKSFVFASSCSVYGAGGELPKTEADPLDPLTAYAQSKVQAEADLKQYAASDFTVTCLRFATACGPSTRMRLDLVLNDFVATALTERRLVILSDGTPWRPLIDTRDMSNALIWAAERPAENGGAYLAVNAGSDDWNFSILDLAKRVQRFYSGIEIEVNTSAPPDKRSYVVDFSQFQKLAPDVYPKRPLEDSIAAIDRALDHSSHRLNDFRSGPFIRLNVLNNMRNLGILDKHLRWAHQSAARPN